jgi:hypothetical protein
MSLENIRRERNVAIGFFVLGSVGSVAAYIGVQAFRKDGLNAFAVPILTFVKNITFEKVFSAVKVVNTVFVSTLLVLTIMRIGKIDYKVNTLEDMLRAAITKRKSKCDKSRCYRD